MYIFKPTSKQMLQEYPELSKEIEFHGMSDEEIKFCWYVGNITSPYVKKLKRIRYQQAAKKTIKSEDKRKKYADGFFDEKIGLGIKKMETYRTDVRDEANRTVLSIFDNIVRVVEVDNKELLAMDVDAKGKYVKMALMAGKELPDLVRIVEQGFGVEAEMTANDKRSIKESKSNLNAAIEEANEFTDDPK